MSKSRGRGRRPRALTVLRALLLPRALTVRRALAVLLLFGFPGVVLTAAAEARASYVWRNVTVGGGGFAPNIVFSRAQRGLAYLRTDMGGVYRWEASAGRWIPLQDGMAESSYFGIESIAADPVDPGVVYVAAGMYRRGQAAILRSRDRGNTWEVFPTSFRMGGNEEGRGVGERLAIDPNDRSVLYFGSRHDGLQRSADRGQTWSPVASFTVRGRGVPEGPRRTNAGISFVVLDPASGGSLRGSRTLFVGVADPGEQHLFRSDDAGVTWVAVAGQPRADLLPVRAELDDRGVLYLAYSNGVGPNGVTDGAVYKYDIHSGAWTDITPEKGPDRAKGGYMGLSLDRQRPDTLVVASLNRWRPGDILWRSEDGGRTWRNLRESSRHDVAASPFLLWGAKEADFGWWMAGVAIDPFDSGFAAYTTGATVYATHDVGNSGKGAPIIWRPWVEGIEQTAVITLVSPPEGPALLSGFGDISGFAHENLAVSPAEQFTNPVFSNTNTIDYAALSPNVVVRSGTPAPRAPPATSESGAPTLAFSTDHGRTWSPLEVPPVSETNVQGVEPNVRGAAEKRRYDLTGDRAITTSADGEVFMFMAPQPLITRDRGKTWTQVKGLPAGARAIADRADAGVFYALDFEHSAVFLSTDRGQTFAALPATGLPADIRSDRPTSREAPWPFVATPGRRGDLWFVSHAGLFHSVDGGHSFREARGGVSVTTLSFGRAPPGSDYPAMFALGVRGDTYAIWRSDDVAASWMRVNDSRHEYGRRFRCISGDPRVFGRVYVGTDGRGIVYGEPMGERGAYVRDTLGHTPE